MDKFSPKKAKRGEEKRPIPLRLSISKIGEIEAAATRADLSRNEFICQCIDFALAHMQLEDENEERP